MSTEKTRQIPQSIDEEVRILETEIALLSQLIRFIDNDDIHTVCNRIQMHIYGLRKELGKDNDERTN